MTIVTVQNSNTVTVSQVLDRYEKDCVPSLAPRTQKDYARHLETLRQTFGHWIADELRPKDFADFLNVKKGKIQRNRQLAVLSAAFSEAVGRWFWMERNMLKDVKRNPSTPRNRYVTDDEYARCKAIAPPRVQLAMELALLTGQRQGDLISLKWEQVQDMSLLFTQSKTGKRLAVTITPDLEAVLDKCWKLKKGGGDGGLYVIGTRTGKPYTSEGFRACWQRTQKKYVKGGNIRFSFHDLRAKSASDSVSIDAAYQRLGHTSMSMTRRVYDRGVRVVKPLR